MNNLMKRIMSVAMAAITTTSPILSSYTVYASDITVNDDGTVTQISTSTDLLHERSRRNQIFIH